MSFNINNLVEHFCGMDRCLKVLKITLILIKCIPLYDEKDIFNFIYVGVGFGSLSRLIQPNPIIENLGNNFSKFYNLFFLFSP